MKYVILDNEHNDIIAYFETYIPIDYLKDTFKQYINNDNYADAQFEFANWLSKQPNVEIIELTHIYVYGPACKARFEISKEEWREQNN